MAKLFLITTYRRGVLSEDLTAHPTVTMAIDCVVAAAVQISAAVQTPFLTLCNASMGVSCLVVCRQGAPSDKLLYFQHHLPSSIRILKYLEILRPPGLHTKSISEQSGIEASKLSQSLTTAMHMASTYTSSLVHILRLFATRHILREVTLAVFATNRISSLIQARAPKSCQSSKQVDGMSYSNSLFALEDLSLNITTQTG
jgi:hypothetical protein